MLNFMATMATDKDWYWLSSDEKTVFSSARSSKFPPDDAAYRAWRARSGKAASPWPKDEAGNDSDAELAAVLARYGLYTSVAESLVAYANQKQWALATGGYTVTLGGRVHTFPTDPASQGAIEVKAARLARPNPPSNIVWQLPPGFVAIAAEDFQAVADQVADFVEATFATLQIVLSAVATGTITTTAQIDTAHWPSNISNTAK